MNKNTKIVVGIVLFLIVIWGWSMFFKKESVVMKDSVSPVLPISSQPIKIGFIGALTGDGAAYGEPQRNAVMIAVEKINASGGINGNNIEVIYEDGKCNGKGGVNAAQKLVNVDKVQVVLGGSCSGETLAAVPVVETAKVAIITGSATSPDLINKSKFFARTYPNDSTQGRVVAEAAINIKNWKNIAAIHEQTDYALGYYKAFTNRFQELGGSIAAKEEFATTIIDVRSMLVKLRSRNPDALLIATQTPASGDRVLKQLADMGWQVPLIVIDVFINSETESRNKVVLEGALTADFVVDPETNTKLAELMAIYKQKYGIEMAFPGYTSATYDSLFIIKDAIAVVGYDGEKIATWFRTVKNWSGASGMITIGQDGERASGHSLKIFKNDRFVLYK